MTKGFDCATKLNKTAAIELKKAGFEFVARYLGDSWKTFNKDEAKVISDTGLNLISIFEKNSTNLGYFTKTQGISDAKEAESYANAVGQPHGTAIYFTVDYDAQASHMSAILAYLDGVRETLKDYKVGLYGSYDVMMAVKGKVDYYWQTYAWSKGQVADHIHMHQYQNSVTVAGVSLDRDDIKMDPGAWVLKDEPKPVQPKPTSKKDPNEGYMHIVATGETLSGIAAKYGLSVDYLAKLNEIDNPDRIYAGQHLKLKGKVADGKTAAPKHEYHTVKKGDTFWDLENELHLKHGTLQRLNPKVQSNRLQIGQKIRVK